MRILIKQSADDVDQRVNTILSLLQKTLSSHELGCLECVSIYLEHQSAITT